MDEKQRDRLRAQLQIAAQNIHNGQAAQAGAIYDQVVELADSDPVLNVELGNLCTMFGAFDKAVKHFQIAVDDSPDDAMSLGCLGVALLKCGEIEPAFEALHKAEAIDDSLPLISNGLGLAHMEYAEFSEAAEYFEKAYKAQPNDSQIAANLAYALIGLNEHDQALELARKAIKLNPKLLPAQYAVGRILTETGKADEAVRHYEQMIRKNRIAGPAYDALARLKKFKPDDDVFIGKAEKALETGMPPFSRLSIHFALGKAYDDCKDYEKAFEHFRLGNLLQKYPYEIDNDRRWFKQQTKAFTGKSIANFAREGHPSEQPVFIVGMPRSGTTLLERIIASHSQAGGAGELPTIPRLAHRIVGERDRNPAAVVRKNLTPERMQELAEEYLRVLSQGHENTARTVDKLPGNYQQIGLIASLFPNARIINIMRNPLDTCLSCYFQAFGQVRWANDLRVIASIYRLYRDYMSYWQNELPDGRIFNVQYEALIDDPEAEARKVIDHCGLDWEPGILEFHQSDGVVKTVSQWQVRQPIYKSSRRRWQNYANHVQELANQLADYLEDEKTLLAEHGIELDAPGLFGWLRFG